ncbi:MAG: hypothetical protein ACD_46C00119G0001, partial [uncultured bacterium]
MSWQILGGNVRADSINVGVRVKLNESIQDANGPLIKIYDIDLKRYLPYNSIELVKDVNDSSARNWYSQIMIHIPATQDKAYSGKYRLEISRAYDLTGNQLDGYPSTIAYRDDVNPTQWDNPEETIDKTHVFFVGGSHNPLPIGFLPAGQFFPPAKASNCNNCIDFSKEAGVYFGYGESKYGIYSTPTRDSSVILGGNGDTLISPSAFASGYYYFPTNYSSSDDWKYKYVVFIPSPHYYNNIEYVNDVYYENINSQYFFLYEFRDKHYTDENRIDLQVTFCNQNNIILIANSTGVFKVPGGTVVGHGVSTGNGSIKNAIKLYAFHKADNTNFNGIDEIIEQLNSDGDKGHNQVNPLAAIQQYLNNRG